MDRQDEADILVAEKAAIFAAAPSAVPVSMATESDRGSTDRDMAALCLSGGGIRSAAFSLGVIQGLAGHQLTNVKGDQHPPSSERSLLAQFHYLSTVSGGGYIGGWLSAWRNVASFDEIWKALTNVATNPFREPREVRWIRSYSSYLTPRRGFFSLDTFSVAALSIRNLLLNWLVMAAPFFACLLALKFFGVLSNWLIQWSSFHPNGSMQMSGNKWVPEAYGIDQDKHKYFIMKFYIQVILSVFCGILSIGAYLITIFLLNDYRPSNQRHENYGPSQKSFIFGPFIFSFVAAYFMTTFLASDIAGLTFLECAKTGPEGMKLRLGIFWACLEHAPPTNGYLTLRHPWYLMEMGGAVIGITTYLTAWVLAKSIWRDIRDALAWIAAGAAHGAAVTLAFIVYLKIPDAGIGSLSTTYLHLALGVPWLLLAQVLSSTVFVGFSSFGDRSEADREWFARVDAFYLIAALGWIYIIMLVFFEHVLIEVPPSAIEMLQNKGPAVIAVTGAIAAFLGKSNIVPPRPEDISYIPKILNVLVILTSFIFCSTLIVFFSLTIDNVILGGGLCEYSDNMHPSFYRIIDVILKFIRDPSNFSLDSARPCIGRLETVKRTIIAFIVAVSLTLLSSSYININRFSLHSMYRNRIVRAFLGAPREDRKPNPLDQFDTTDNLPLHRLWPRDGHPGWRPFHVINMTLNLVGSDDLAIQERKAVSFTASPLHCGSAPLGYRDSALYGGPSGLSLGTALAISGAAASPNMGYHSSRAVAFLMTLFNVRLGWWLGNPDYAGHETFMKEGPRFAIKSLLSEAIGLTTSKNRFVYLSDGGHFENLGLYEMIRRRCRHIVVCDATCDPDFEFADLGNAVRRIKVDFGVSITFPNLGRLKKRGVIDGSGPSPYHTVGDIDYGLNADGSRRKGYVLYIKPSFHETESVDIASYAKVHRRFPHESTMDQFFTESQFESYRNLGFDITSKLLETARPKADGPSTFTLDEMFAALRDES